MQKTQKHTSEINLTLSFSLADKNVPAAISNPETFPASDLLTIDMDKNAIAGN